MRLAASVLTIAALLSLPSAAIAGPDLERAATAGAARGIDRFGNIYGEGGISAAADAVRACYRSHQAKRGAEDWRSARRSMSWQRSSMPKP